MENDKENTLLSFLCLYLYRKFSSIYSHTHMETTIWYVGLLFSLSKRFKYTPKLHVSMRWKGYNRMSLNFLFFFFFNLTQPGFICASRFMWLDNGIKHKMIDRNIPALISFKRWLISLPLKMKILRYTYKSVRCPPKQFVEKWLDNLIVFQHPNTSSLY